MRVKEGPFADFTGQIAEINADHMKLKVLVNIFGRETLVEMDFSQVAKLERRTSVTRTSTAIKHQSHPTIKPHRNQERTTPWRRRKS